MELVLNLGWVVLAIVMCWLWTRHPALRERTPRGTQLVALTLVLATMFVVITLYDDMAMAQSAAETSGVQREDASSGTNAQAAHHQPATFTQPQSLKLSFGACHVGVLTDHAFQPVFLPALMSIQNRPPPSI